MGTAIAALLDPQGLTPHGFCLLWEPGLIWLHAGTDAIIAVAYLSISLALIYFVRRRIDLAFGWIVWLFAGFILACGGTHVMALVTLWQPYYWLDGAVKLATAIASMITAVALWPLIPRALALPSPADLRVMMERQARQREQGLRARHEAAAAVEANLAKSRFFAAASHDLRQPLHAIGLFLGVLRSGSAAAKTTEVLDNMAVAVASMQRMFNELLDVVRLDVGMMAARPKTVRLQTIFDVLRANFVPSAEAKGLVLRVHPSPAVVTTDPVLLQSVLQNLLSNAINYTTRGEVALEARQPGDRVEIMVQDTGHGIPQDRLEDIFQEFVRLDRTGGADAGMGLGLAIVQRLAAVLGANIDVQSTVGVGSVFTLILPPALLPEAQRAAPHEHQRHSLAGARILIVEDHKLVLRAMALEVEAWGARPLAAASADEAMTLLAMMAPETPDAAVVDLDLGGETSGIVLLDMIKAKFGKIIPAVILTGSTSADDMALLNASGHAWLTKPIEPGVLQGAVGARIAVVGAAATPER